MRPLLIVNNGLLTLNPDLLDTRDGKIDYLVREGMIEYLDSLEEENMMIAFDLAQLKEGKCDYTHCEIHPTMLMGVCASRIPFSGHNQTTKNTLQSAMCKQSIGMNTMNIHQRMESVSHMAYYPERPIVKTVQNKYTGGNELTTGSNPIVAFMCFTGYNQEDSLILNQSAIDRGLFRSWLTQTEVTMEEINIRHKTQKVIGPKNFLSKDDDEADRHLDEDGIITPGK